MQGEADILISIRGRFIDSMLAGNKRIELRRRAPKIASPTRMWIYDTAPTASVRALAVVSGIKTLSPREMWDQFSGCLDLDRAEYDEYVQGKSTVAALLLCHVNALKKPVELSLMRALAGGFHPPQFYLKLNRNGPIVTRLTEEILCDCTRCAA